MHQSIDKSTHNNKGIVHQNVKAPSFYPRSTIVQTRRRMVMYIVKAPTIEMPKHQTSTRKLTTNLSTSDRTSYHINPQPTKVSTNNPISQRTNDLRTWVVLWTHFVVKFTTRTWVRTANVRSRSIQPCTFMHQRTTRPIKACVFPHRPTTPYYTKGR
jgi:hypothetical protein